MTVKDLRPVSTRSYKIRSGGGGKAYSQIVVSIPHVYLHMLGQSPDNPDVSVRMYTTEQGWLVLVPVDNTGAEW